MATNYSPTTLKKIFRYVEDKADEYHNKYGLKIDDTFDKFQNFLAEHEGDANKALIRLSDYLDDLIGN